MGKKNRKTHTHTSTTASSTPASLQELAAGSTNAPSSPSAASTPIYYPSDGPSDVELLQTTSSSLQAKLNQLTELAMVNNRAAFVEQFVPLDLSPADAHAYLQDLSTAPEAEGQWRNLVAEIAAIRSGHGVDRIEGDQVTRASFFFRHPLLEKCDREVTFVCNGNGEWRADG